MAINDVKRALVRADVRALANRTQLPEDLVMSVCERANYDIDACAMAIDETMNAAALAIEAEVAQVMSGGNPGGGKSAFQAGHHTNSFIAHCRTRYVSDLQLRRPLGGIVTTCVS